MCGWCTPKKRDIESNEALGRSRGGFSTKIHVAVDALGNPLRFILTGGQRSDCKEVLNLMEGFSFELVLADRGYDSHDILSRIEKLDAKAVIPARANRTEPRETDWHLYKNRHLVECFINKIKHYRRIFSRFEKYAKRYMAFLQFVAALIWFK